MPANNPAAYFNPAAFDLPQYQGPLGAPITQGMFAALQGIKNTTNADPLGQSNDILNQILGMTGGEGPVTGDINTRIANFGMPENVPRFNTTPMFRDLRTIFNQDLYDQTAELKEQFSGLGLGQGSTDRLNAIASNAGNARARFGAALSEIARQSFEDAEARRLAGRGQNIDILGQQLQGALIGRGQDIDLYGQRQQGANNLFNAEGILQQLADTEAQRAYEEFVRTQGGGFNQMIDYLRSLPEGTVAVGPSTGSQIANIGGQIVSNLPELIEAGKVGWDAIQGVWKWLT